MAKYGSRTQMEKEGPVYKPFKAGSYICKLANIKVTNKKNYHQQMVDMVQMNFLPYESNARKPEMFDIEGGEVKPLTRKLFLDIEKFSMGFRDNFTVPSKLRSLIAALLNADPHEEMDGPDKLEAHEVAEFLGKYEGDYVVVNVLTVEKNDKKRNKITEFLPVPEDFEPDEVIEANAQQKEKERAQKDSSPDPEAKVEDVKEEELEEETEPAESEEDKPKKEKATKKPLF